MIANGANGHCGVIAPKVAIPGIKPGKEQLLSRQTLGGYNVLENQLKPNNAIPNHVPSIVSGVNGVLGVNVLKPVMVEPNIGIAPKFKLLSLEGISVQDKQV